MKFLCEQCKAKYQIADDKAAGKTVRMKCRKCGHLIEVRAGVADAGGVSRSSRPPASPAAGPATPSPGASAAGAPRAPQRPAPPRATGLATSLAAAKPAAKTGDRNSSALAGAFRSSVQRDHQSDETSAPFDMSDLSPGDEWYVAINGVPVGPIRVTEVRRKAALGAVTEESLCWQEGLDEWRPVRSFPDLAAVVRDALASGRASLPPAPGEARSEGRGSVAPPARSPSTRVPGGVVGMAPKPAARPAPTPAPAMAARSNVVPIMSRLATAERLDDVPDDRTKPFEGAVVADPFANPPAPAAMAAPMATQTLGAMSEASAASIAAPPPQRKAPPWMAIAMVAAACAFGVTAALAVFLRPAPAPTPVVVQVPMPGVPGLSPTATTGATAPAPTDTTAPDPGATSTSGHGPVAMNGGPRPGAGSGAAATTATAAAKGPLDLGGLGGTAIRPTDDTANDGPKAPGQCFSSGQVSQVIGLHQPGIRRSCWERNPTTKNVVNVSVSMTIGADGSPGGVSASAEEPSVAKCVENDVRTWRFPAMGCTQATSFSLKFVRQ